MIRIGGDFAYGVQGWRVGWERGSGGSGKIQHVPAFLHRGSPNILLEVCEGMRMHSRRPRRPGRLRWMDHMVPSRESSQICGTERGGKKQPSGDLQRGRTHVYPDEKKARRRLEWGEGRGVTMWLEVPLSGLIFADLTQHWR